MMCRKILIGILIAGLLFQQSGFAQIVPGVIVPADLRSMLPSDWARPVQLRAISVDVDHGNLRLMLDRADERQNSASNMDSALINYFSIGLALPNSMFWVNLRPDSDKDIIDPNLEKTDLGRILLESDLQLKRDLAKCLSPDTTAGKQYWEKLYNKAEKLFGSENISVPTYTRPWIVPGEVLIKETAGSAFIYKATLKVMLEQDYIKDALQVTDSNDPRFAELNAYSSGLIRELIIPSLTRQINASKRYASLRQVYYSLILAQWYKARFGATAGQVMGISIDQKNLTGLTSARPWSKQTYYQEYQKSVSHGEFDIEDRVQTGSQLVIRRYVSGGIVPIMNSVTAIKGTVSPGWINDLRQSGSNVVDVPITPEGMKKDGGATLGDILSEKGIKLILRDGEYVEGVNVVAGYSGDYVTSRAKIGFDEKSNTLYAAKGYDKEAVLLAGLAAGSRLFADETINKEFRDSLRKRLADLVESDHSNLFQVKTHDLNLWDRQYSEWALTREQSIDPAPNAQALIEQNIMEKRIILVTIDDAVDVDRKTRKERIIERVMYEDGETKVIRNVETKDGGESIDRENDRPSDRLWRTKINIEIKKNISPDILKFFEPYDLWNAIAGFVSAILLDQSESVEKKFTLNSADHKTKDAISESLELKFKFDRQSGKVSMGYIYTFWDGSNGNEMKNPITGSSEFDLTSLSGDQLKEVYDYMLKSIISFVAYRIALSSKRGFEDYESDMDPADYSVSFDARTRNDKLVTDDMQEMLEVLDDEHFDQAVSQLKEIINNPGLYGWTRDCYAPPLDEAVRQREDLRKAQNKDGGLLTPAEKQQLFSELKKLGLFTPQVGIDIDALETLQKDGKKLHKNKKQWEINDPAIWNIIQKRTGDARQIQERFDVIDKKVGKLAKSGAIPYKSGARRTIRKILVTAAILNSEDIMFMTALYQISTIYYQFIVQRTVGQSPREYPSFNLFPPKALGFGLTEALNPKVSRQFPHMHPNVERTYSGSDHTRYIDYQSLIMQLSSWYGFDTQSTVAKYIRNDILYALYSLWVLPEIRVHYASVDLLFDDYTRGNFNSIILIIGEMVAKNTYGNDPAKLALANAIKGKLDASQISADRVKAYRLLGEKIVQDEYINGWKDKQAEYQQLNAAITPDEKTLLLKMVQEVDIENLETNYFYYFKIPMGAVVETPKNYSHTIRNASADAPSLDWTLKDLFLQIFKLEDTGKDPEGYFKVRYPNLKTDKKGGWTRYKQVFKQMVAQIKTDSNGNPKFEFDKEQMAYNPAAQHPKWTLQLDMIAINPNIATPEFDFKPLYGKVQMLRLMPWPGNLAKDWNLGKDRIELKAAITIIKEDGTVLQTTITGGEQLILSNEAPGSPIVKYSIKNVSEGNHEIMVITPFKISPRGIQSASGVKPTPSGIPAPAKAGGIDLRTVQAGPAMQTFSTIMPAADMALIKQLASNSQMLDLSAEWERIQAAAQKKAIPYGKLKELAAVSCFRQEAIEYREKVYQFILNTLAAEEACAVQTTGELKELLCILESSQEGLS